MNAEILSVGTELLLGDIVNTNAQYIAKRLADIGTNVYHQTVVGDNPERLKNAYMLAFERADLVIATGGLGPTKDDLTKEIAAEYFGKKLVLDRFSYKKIEDYFTKMSRPFSENNKKQAYMPEDAFILPNDHGTAPGCIIHEKGKILVLLPGPPREMAPMFEESVIPYLIQFQDGVLVSKTLRVIGVGESLMEQKVIDLIESQTNPTIAPYAKEGEAILRITAKAKTVEEAHKMILPVEAKIRERLGENIYAEGEVTLEDVVGEMLIQRNLSISTAESCTGGGLAARLINYPGISSSYLEGVVTYSNEAKMLRLGVKEETLKNFGAVSEQTAREMAVGIAERSATDIGISVTGIAGPGGGTQDKPVGLVYIGLYIRGNVNVREYRFVGDRQQVRNRTIIEGLDWLRRELLKL